ncbi:hypothetical protein [Cyanobium sp. NIES-981]|uniref:hypothetical protein n=1 Tax=Cyanobium sp. NIES-981 TaxID=1851505 RepID=UPI0007DE1FB9|nr:hypothetical protein [Cyanobium sp. NIES-981]SBO43801.1 Uncharacterized secreted protein [Cyanobium sp. NIES-981]
MNQPWRPLALCCTITVALASQIQVSANPRATFPGRLVGGGTRGECSARMLVHLVPRSSVFAPGDPSLLGLLEGPSSQPRPLVLRFRPQTGTAPATERLLLSGGAALVLVQGPGFPDATLWESSYRCDDGLTAGASGDPLQVVSTSSPPALSLLVQDTTPDDARFQLRLQQLRGRCGGMVSRAELISTFELGDLLGQDWPELLPVRCPS